MSIDVLHEWGMENAAAVVEAADEVGLPLWIAAAVVEKESSGRNVYGADRGGVFSVLDPDRPVGAVVTAENYAVFERRVLGGETSNGVGPAQITWPGFIRDAKDKGVKLWVPVENLTYGFSLVAGYLDGGVSDDDIRDAGRRYNGSQAYGDDLVVKAMSWKARLEEERPVGTVSALGWASVSKAGARRPGPHGATGSNPREIGFRNHATADLLAGAMWLIHTGSAGRLDDVYVSEWHGLRPVGSAFGTANSDHNAGVAMDVNWSWHPWERSVGQASYDRHMSAFKASHAVFDAVEQRLTVPGARPILRWCGRDWSNSAGVGYSRGSGNRDCMHWVIEAPNWTRINAAAARLRTWFQPPRTVSAVKSIQRRIGAKDDGQFGPASVKAMRVEQTRLGVARTGLPGDVATRTAWAREDAGPDYSGFSVAEIKTVQELLKTCGWYVGSGTGIDGLPGPNFQKAMKKAQEKLKVEGLYSGKVDLLPGPKFMAALRQWAEPPGPDYSGFSVAYIEAAQRLLKEGGWYDASVDGSPGPAFQGAMKKAQAELKAEGLYVGEVDLLPGPKFMAALREWLEPKPLPLKERMIPFRVQGATAEETAVLLDMFAVPDGQGVLLVARDSPDHPGAAIVAGRNPAVLVCLVQQASAGLSPATIDGIKAAKPTWVVGVGGVTDEALYEALTIAGIKVP